jgi:hypothetical protein
MSNKIRILLTTTIFGRDIGASYVLAKILEHMGCACYISGSNTSYSCITKLWAPHAVIAVTLNKAKELGKIYPNANLYYYPAEGGESYEYCTEKYFAEDADLFHRIKRIYLWGNFTKGHIFQRINELKEASYLYGNEGILGKKCMVVGNPRLDIIRYFPEDLKYNKQRIRIGLVGWFNQLNSKSRGYVIRKMLSGTSIEDAEFQFDLLLTYVKIIEELDPSKYEISIRPYPLETLKEYLEATWAKNGKIKIDQSLEFGTWALNQDLIIGPTSSTLSQIAIAKRPFINLDALSKRSVKAYKNSIRAVFLRHVENHCPKDFKELFNMIENYEKFSVETPEFENVLNDIYNCNKKDSCLLHVATNIVETIHSDPPSIRRGIPKRWLEWIDQIRFKDNPNSYNWFLYNQFKDRLFNELDPVVQNILKSLKSNEFRSLPDYL